MTVSYSSSLTSHLLLIFFICLGSNLVLKGVNCWFNGHATYYGAYENPTSLGGACGYDNTFHAGFGINTAALSGALFRGGETCGACYQLRCNVRTDPKWCLRHSSVIVTATNFCPPNGHGGACDPPRQHFDMSMPAFFRIARRGNEGIIPVLYRRSLQKVCRARAYVNSSTVVVGAMQTEGRGTIHIEGSIEFQYDNDLERRRERICEGCMDKGIKDEIMGSDAPKLGCELAKQHRPKEPKTVNQTHLSRWENLSVL
ncbi:Expansin [Macleaya cordata]|uniref:Expansin n=1 Tax=Macleaya cordata TaxID=56857 RepID=A0A200PQU3_MACCD|nr:Expansin [Macleaya cordata]